VRVVIISDTHERLHEVALPLGDVLVHTGDITFCARGGFTTLATFNEYMSTLPHPHKIVIAGNHDRHLEHIGKEAARRLFTSAHYLENCGIWIHGLHFWGTPFSSVRATRPALAARVASLFSTPALKRAPPSPPFGFLHPRAEAPRKPIEQPRLSVLSVAPDDADALHPE
jgi:hypothetical protein